MSDPVDPRKDDLFRRVGRAEWAVRRSRLAGQHGTPESIAASDALAMAMTALVPVDPTVTADDVWASAYRDALVAQACERPGTRVDEHRLLDRTVPRIVPRPPPAAWQADLAG